MIRTDSLLSIPCEGTDRSEDFITLTSQFQSSARTAVLDSFYQFQNAPWFYPDSISDSLLCFVNRGWGAPCPVVLNADPLEKPFEKGQSSVWWSTSHQQVSICLETYTEINQVEFVNPLGQFVEPKWQQNDREVTVQGAGLSTGIWLVRWTDIHGKAETRRFWVE